MTFYRSIRTDLIDAGAKWIDARVFDIGLITSRNATDLDTFNEKIVEVLAAGMHAGAKHKL